MYWDSLWFVRAAQVRNPERPGTAPMLTSLQGVYTRCHNAVEPNIIKKVLKPLMSGHSLPKHTSNLDASTSNSHNATNINIPPLARRAAVFHQDILGHRYKHSLARHGTQPLLLLLPD